MRFATRSVFFCNKNVLQRVQRDFTIKKKKKRETYEKGGERERGKKGDHKKRGTLCVLAVFRVFSIFFFLSFFGRGKRGGGGVDVSHS